MPRHDDTIKKGEKKLEELIQNQNFDICCREGKDKYKGPSLYFHLKTIEKLRELGSPKKAIQDDRFCELLYATLTAWGMHRMNKNTQLKNLHDIKKSLNDRADEIEKLSRYNISERDEEEVEDISEKIWAVIRQLEIRENDNNKSDDGDDGTKIVVGSKTLHHLLPDLVPPIDRNNTLQFFFDTKSFVKDEKDDFKVIYKWIHKIALFLGILSKLYAMFSRPHSKALARRSDQVFSIL